LLSNTSSAISRAQIPLQIATDKGTIEGDVATDGKVVASKGTPYIVSMFI
jgi:hypothetical protein